MMGWITAWQVAPKWLRTMIFGGLFLAAIGGSMFLFSRWVAGIRESGVVEGKAQEREAATGIIIKNVGIAKDAKQEIQSQAHAGSGSALYAECLRSARTPANCQRFMPAD